MNAHSLIAQLARAMRRRAEAFARMKGYDAESGRHLNCANCLEYALSWRSELLDRRAA